MKFSVKLLDHHHHKNQNHHAPPLLLRAKIPITILNLPFLSHFSTTTTHPSDLSLSLSSNFPTGPSLKLSYAAAAATTTTTPPLTVTLKSGTGLFGSPKNSPLVISAHFSFNPSSNFNNPNPTFSLLFKPQLGSFSLRKSTCSHVESGVRTEPDSNSFGFVPLERPIVGGVKEIPEIAKIDRGKVFKGIELAARTEMPVGKRVGLDFRWGVGFPKDDLPVLRINKIGIHRVYDVLKVDDEDKKKEGNSSGELEMLKGMCFWMKRELDDLTRVNREMKCEFEEMKKVGYLGRNGSGGDFSFRGGARKKVVPEFESGSSGFEQWRSKKNGGIDENGDLNWKKEEKKNDSLAIDVESELQRAIKAAASC